MRASNLHGEEREAEGEAEGSMECVSEAVAEQCPMASSSLDSRPLFQTLYDLVDSNVAFFQEGSSDTGRRFLASFLAIREHARHLEPVLSHFATIFHLFDLDEHTPANGYRSLAHIVHCCLAHIIHKSHYVATNRHSIFFRASHNCAELEAYCSALTQLRALVYLAQSLLTHNQPGSLFSQEGEPLSELLLQEYVTMHKGCFYGRCMGFQFAPSIRPFLQTIAISLVSFGENYKRHDSGIGVMASSICTSGKFVIDPELRGLAFERTTQNLDVHFWKSFWNLTEMELLVSLASMGASQVRLSRPLLVPPHSFELPLAADPKLTVTITPPVAHSGPGPVQMRLISHELREGQDSEELNNLLRPEVTLALELRWKSKLLPRSPYLVVHFHGGGFVAQTSKSHEPYLKIWAQELGAPILSIDYALSPEAPFPRALEECFYAYCWALKNCHLLGSTAERVCLAGDSAGGNLCITVSMRAAAVGIRMPDGIMAAYPVTLLQAVASPSRLLTLFDPLLPLSVLCRCLNAYAGIEEEPEDSALVKLSPMNVRRDTARIFRDLRLSASALFGSRLESTSKINGAGGASGHRPPSQGRQGYFGRPVAQLCLVLSLARPYWSQGPFGANAAADTMRKSVSEGGLKSKPLAYSKDSCKSQTCQNLSCTSEAPLDPGPGPGFSLSNREHEATSSTPSNHMTFPDGFQPLHSDQPAIHLLPKLSPILKNPFVSPLLAPDEMLQGLPPIHIVACALDPMLDESVTFARRLRTLGQPVTLRVVQDLPHGFLSLSQLSRETREALAVCTESIRDVLTSEAPAAGQAPAAADSPRKHRQVERTFSARPAPAPETGPEGLNGVAAEGWAAPSTTDNAAPDPQEPRSTAPGEPPSGAAAGAVPPRGPSSEAAGTPGQDCSPSGGTVGRGVGA